MKRIAVVDDNDDLLFTIKYGINKIDKTFEVVTFNDPNIFLKSLKKEKFDIILLDIMMPQKNGWDTYAEITKTKNNKVPVLFLTAKTDKQSMILGSSGAKDYITKPIEIKDLLEKIKKNL